MEFMGFPINILAIVISALVAFGIGFVWYAVLFKTIWPAAHGFTPQKMAQLSNNSPAAMGVSFVGYLVTATVLSLIFAQFNINDIQTALGLTFSIWLGFPAVMSLMNAMYSGESLTVYAIDIVYELIYSLTTACIIVMMK